MCADLRDRTSITDTELNTSLQTVWECAARQNPLLLAKLRPDYSLERLRELIRDCLAQGMPAAEAQDHAVRQLLRLAIEDSHSQKRREQAGGSPQTIGKQPTP